MSLKAFHIVFIVISTLFTLGLGAWGVFEFRNSQNISFLAYTVGAVVTIVALLFYLQAFLHKIRNIQAS